MRKPSRSQVDIGIRLGIGMKLCDNVLHLLSSRYLHGRCEESMFLAQPMQNFPLVDIDVAEADVREPFGPQDRDTGIATPVAEPFQSSHRGGIGKPHNER